MPLFHICNICVMHPGGGPSGLDHSYRNVLCSTPWTSGPDDASQRVVPKCVFLLPPPPHTHTKPKELRAHLSEGVHHIVALWQRLIIREDDGVDVRRKDGQDPLQAVLGGAPGVHQLVHGHMQDLVDPIPERYRMPAAEQQSLQDGKRPDKWL